MDEQRGDSPWRLRWRFSPRGGADVRLIANGRTRLRYGGRVGEFAAGCDGERSSGTLRAEGQSSVVRANTGATGQAGSDRAGRCGRVRRRSHRDLRRSHRRSKQPPAPRSSSVQSPSVLRKVRLPPGSPPSRVPWRWRHDLPVEPRADHCGDQTRGLPDR